LSSREQSRVGALHTFAGAVGPGAAPSRNSGRARRMRLSRSYRIIFQRPQSHLAGSAPCLAAGTTREARSLLRQAIPTNEIRAGQEAAQWTCR
jgi:hypothetical protein